MATLRRIQDMDGPRSPGPSPWRSQPRPRRLRAPTSPERHATHTCPPGADAAQGPGDDRGRRGRLQRRPRRQPGRDRRARPRRQRGRRRDRDGRGTRGDRAVQHRARRRRLLRLLRRPAPQGHGGRRARDRAGHLHPDGVHQPRRVGHGLLDRRHLGAVDRDARDPGDLGPGDPTLRHAVPVGPAGTGPAAGPDTASSSTRRSTTRPSRTPRASRCSRRAPRSSCRAGGPRQSARPSPTPPSPTPTASSGARAGRWLYHGRLAAAIAAEAKPPRPPGRTCWPRGTLHKRDLERYDAPGRRPIHSTYRGLDVYGMPIPSSGGIDGRRDAQPPPGLRPAHRGCR